MSLIHSKTINLTLLTGLLGINTDQLKDAATDVAHEAIKTEFKAMCDKDVPAIVSQIKADKKTCADGKSFPEVVRDILYRVWRHRLPMKGFSQVVDKIRDSQDDKIIATVSTGADQNTPIEILVQRVSDACVDLTF